MKVRGDLFGLVCDRERTLPVSEALELLFCLAYQCRRQWLGFIMLDPRTQAQVLVRHSDSTLQILWAWYWGNGGNVGLVEFDAYLYDLIPLDAFDLQILTWALEDYAMDRT